MKRTWSTLKKVRRMGVKRVPRRNSRTDSEVWSLLYLPAHTMSRV